MSMVDYTDSSASSGASNETKQEAQRTRQRHRRNSTNAFCDYDGLSLSYYRLDGAGNGLRQYHASNQRGSEPSSNSTKLLEFT